jgi:hypothetical protein
VVFSAGACATCGREEVSNGEARTLTNFQASFPDAELRGIPVQAALAGRLHLPCLRRRAHGVAEELRTTYECITCGHFSFGARRRSAISSWSVAVI